MKKNNIFGLILVRSTSSRLKNKCFLPFGRGNVLEHVIKRCKYFKIKPIVCTSIQKQDNKIIKICKKLNTKYFRGSLKNKILRIYECCLHFGITSFHTIDADDPFFCDKEIKKSMLMLKNADLVLPSTQSSNGHASVGYSSNLEVFKLLASKVKKNEDTEMMSGFLKKYNNFKIKKLPNMQKLAPKKIRLTLDYFEDYIFLNLIRKKLGNFTSRKKILSFLKKNKYLIEINYFRHLEWKNNQALKLNKIK